MSAYIKPIGRPGTEQWKAMMRELIELAALVPEIRRPTRPTRNSQKRRVDTKVRRGQVKLQRGRVKDA